MRGFLLDTNIALLATFSPERLPDSLIEDLQRKPIHLSVLTYWEVVLKSGKGKLKIGHAATWWRDVLDQLAAGVVLLRPEHIAKVHRLPAIHQDPFDRAMVAQAMVEDLTIVTTDALISKYKCRLLTVRL